MEEAAFQSALGKFRAVRARTSVASFRKPRHHAPQAEARDGGRGALAGAATLRASAPLKDFWGGLSSFLAEHYTAEQAKAISTAFDELHYTSVRSLNLEDNNALAAVLSRECG